MSPDLLAGIVDIVGETVNRLTARVRALEEWRATFGGQAASAEGRSLPSDVGVGFHQSQPTKPRVTYRGAWRVGETYQPGDGVLMRDGSGWICKSATTTSVPGGDGEYWASTRSPW